MKYQFLLVLAALSGCSKTSEVVTFEFVHGRDVGAPTYRASTADTSVIARAREELAKPFAQRSLHIHGKISAGQGNNSPWRWHFDESEWTLAEISMELCDAQPSHVNENLDQWLAEVGSYCPWSAIVSRET